MKIIRKSAGYIEPQGIIADGNANIEIKSDKVIITINTSSILTLPTECDYEIVTFFGDLVESINENVLLNSWRLYPGNMIQLRFKDGVWSHMNTGNFILGNNVDQTYGWNGVKSIQIGNRNSVDTGVLIGNDGWAYQGIGIGFGVNLNGGVNIGGSNSDYSANDVENGISIGFNNAVKRSVLFGNNGNLQNNFCVGFGDNLNIENYGEIQRVASGISENSHYSYVNKTYIPGGSTGNITLFKLKCVGLQLVDYRLLIYHNDSTFKLIKVNHIIVNSTLVSSKFENIDGPDGISVNSADLVDKEIVLTVNFPSVQVYWIIATQESARMNLV